MMYASYPIYPWREWPISRYQAKSVFKSNRGVESNRYFVFKMTIYIYIAFEIFKKVKSTKVKNKINNDAEEKWCAHGDDKLNIFFTSP